MKKKLLSLAIVLAMALSMLPTMAAAAASSCDADEPGDHTKTVSDNGSLAPQTAGNKASFKCTETINLKAHYKCTKCNKLFSSSDGSEGSFSDIADASEYIHTALEEHQWSTDETKSTCTNTATFGDGSQQCTETCDHTGGYNYTSKKDGAKHSKTCKKCGYTPEEDEVCSGGSFQLIDTDTHGKTCTNCGQTYAVAAHNDTNQGKCSDCGYNPDAPSVIISNGSTSKTVAQVTSHNFDISITNAGSATFVDTANLNNSNVKVAIGAGITGLTYTVAKSASDTDGKTVVLTFTGAADFSGTGDVTITFEKTAFNNNSEIQTFQPGTYTLTITSNPIECDGTLSCEAAEGHHNKDCASLCTKNSSCPNTVGKSSAHLVGCPKATTSSGTTSGGTLPSADSVTSSNVSSVVSQAQNVGADKLEGSLEAALSTTSTAPDAAKGEYTDDEVKAAQEVLKQLADLDKAVRDAANITVKAVVESGASTALSAGDITVTNAALNAKPGTKDATIYVRLGTPLKNHNLSRTYSSGNAVAYNITIDSDHVVNNTNLKVPVVITMKPPAGLSASNTVVLHYHGGSDTPRYIYPSVSGDYIRFVVSSFSDFVFTEDTTRRTSGATSVGGSGSYGSITPGVTVGAPITVNTGVTGSGGIFTDVSYSHTFATQILWAKNNSVMSGYADGSFRPNANTTRQALWMVLGRMAGANPADMAAARTWSINAGVSDGTNGGGNMSRQQMITMLYRFAAAQGRTTSGSADLSGYSDSGLVASYAKEAMAWGVANGIITGTSDGKLNPEGAATRAHFAAFAYRYANLPVAAAPAPAPAPAEDTTPAEETAPAEDTDAAEDATPAEDAADTETGDDGVGPDET